MRKNKQKRLKLANIKKVLVSKFGGSQEVMIRLWSPKNIVRTFLSERCFLHLTCVCVLFNDLFFEPDQLAQFKH